MRHTISHTTHYTYDPAAQRAVMRLRLFPPMFEGQYVESWTVTVNDEEITPLSRSGYGDEVAVWTAPASLENIVVKAMGVVERTDTAGISRGLPGRPPKPVFLRQTPLTTKDEAIISFAEQIDADPGLPWLHALNELIHTTMTYESKSTTNETTAAEALAQKKGVCQDFTHIFLSAARHAGFQTRYVVGYLMDADAPEVETHAWAEVHFADLGWVGFDPSHNQCPTEQYIRLCCGMDASDAAPIRGTSTGGTETSHTARVEIETSAQ